jgi:hypothetical protein
MSLADAIVRLQRGNPDRRYAMDPAHLAAIRNYLAMTSRAYDVPYTRRRAEPELTSVLGERHPQFSGLLDDVLHNHDHESLAVALDLHNDVTGEETPPDAHYTGPSSRLDLIHLLAGLHHGIGGQGNVDVPNQFGQQAVDDEAVRSAVRRGVVGGMGRQDAPFGRHLNALITHLRTPRTDQRLMGHGNNLRDLLAGVQDPNDDYNPLRLVPLHDEIDATHETLRGSHPNNEMTALAGTTSNHSVDVLHRAINAMMRGQ